MYNKNQQNAKLCVLVVIDKTHDDSVGQTDNWRQSEVTGLDSVKATEQHDRITAMRFSTRVNIAFGA